ncbi:carboxypeptidase-like regulatory domain-containing protein [uncultured Mitsuokella sp.]|uniref:carboxypeptidase-like regulatory domain-containing protein n=2 Tax=uncultured Mitsuokella sp. TaxID=453120 RepID=UPI002670308F|nr:carboxypeptidase-like regulatory domain-containing protein [uncultured Mitsuokella sp.]
MQEKQSQSVQPQIIIAKSPKSVGIARILTLLFGPLGLLYSTVKGGLILIVVGAVLNMTMHHDYITGKVTDRYDNPIQWVKLTFEAYGGTKGVVTAYTDEDGNYKAVLPIDGSYWITVSQDGDKTHREQSHLDGVWVRNYTLYEE